MDIDFRILNTQDITEYNNAYSNLRRSPKQYLFILSISEPSSSWRLGYKSCFTNALTTMKLFTP